MDFSGKAALSSPAAPARSAPRWSRRLSTAGATCTRSLSHARPKPSLFPHRGACECDADRGHRSGRRGDGGQGLMAGSKPMGLDPHCRRLCGRQRSARPTAALMAQLDRQSHFCFLCCRAAVTRCRHAATAGASSMSRRGRRWNGARGAGMTAYTVAKAGVAALTVALAEEVAKTAFWSMRSRPRSWTRRPIARPCRKPLSTPGRRSRRWRRQSCFSPRPTTRSPAAPSCRCTGSPTPRPAPVRAAGAEGAARVPEATTVRLSA